MKDYWKAAQIKLMIENEENEATKGYGANLNHWAGKAKPINIDIEALKVLLKYYED